MDQRGVGKVRKTDFVSMIERMKISLSRDDISKVWNYIDAKQQGYIQVPELSIAYANRVNNFNKRVEVEVENAAAYHYRNDTAANMQGRSESAQIQTKQHKPKVKSLSNHDPAAFQKSFKMPSGNQTVLANR